MGRPDGVVVMAKAAPAIDAATLAVDYGFALSVLNSDPDLKRIFTQAVAQTWGTDKFEAELRGTKWFQHTSSTAREWTILQSADPATAKQRSAARLQTLKDEAGALGITMNAQQLNDITRNSLMFGWTDDQVRASMSQGWKYDAKTPTAGLAGQTVDKIKQAANDYLVPVSDSAIQAWTQRVLAGTASADDFAEYAKTQARSLFPTLASAIDKGVTVQQYLDPYKQVAAQTLDLNPNDINFMDSKWRAAIDQKDPATGLGVPMSLADWTTHIKTDSAYGYDTTSGGRQAASQLVSALGTAFGFKG